MRLRSGKAYLLITLLAVAGIGIAVAASVDCSTTNAAKTRARIERELPIGTPREAILHWLDDNGIRLLSEGTAGQYSETTRNRVVPTTAVMFASIDAGHAGLVTEKRVDVYFLLDSEGKLTGVIVEDGQSGL